MKLWLSKTFAGPIISVSLLAGWREAAGVPAGCPPRCNPAWLSLAACSQLSISAQGLHGEIGSLDQLLLISRSALNILFIASHESAGRYISLQLYIVAPLRVHAANEQAKVEASYYKAKSTFSFNYHREREICVDN